MTRTFASSTGGGLGPIRKEVLPERDCRSPRPWSYQGGSARPFQGGLAFGNAMLETCLQSCVPTPSPPPSVTPRREEFTE